MGIISIGGNPRGAKLIIVETIFIFLDVVAVAGRIWSRRIQQKALQFNDWSIIVALVVMIARYGNEISSTGILFHSESFSFDSLGSGCCSWFRIARHEY